MNPHGRDSILRGVGNLTEPRITRVIDQIIAKHTVWYNSHHKAGSPPLGDQPSGSIAMFRRYPLRACPQLPTAHRIKEVECCGSLKQYLHGIAGVTLEPLFYQPNERDAPSRVADLHRSRYLPAGTFQKPQDPECASIH